MLQAAHPYCHISSVQKKVNIGFSFRIIWWYLNNKSVIWERTNYNKSRIILFTRNNIVIHFVSPVFCFVFLSCIYL